MLRRLFNSVIETTSIENVFYPHPFTKKETIGFGWLTSAAPCFPVHTTNIRIIYEPEQFYETLLKHCEKATKRITLVSLYLGNGELEKKIVSSLMSNASFRNKKLTVNVLLDYTRGSRFKNNSRTILQPLLLENEKNCTVSLYHTPALRGLIKKIIPNRWNELLGLQHMKLYIFDDTLLISGANLSNDYFTNRQDRYLEVKDKSLTDFYCGLVGRVQKFSLKMDKNNNVSLCKNWGYSPYEGSRNEFVQKAGDLIEEYLIEVKREQNNHKSQGSDTWIFPVVQMGQLGIDQDAQVTEKILAETPRDSKLQIATGYFNLTDQYMKTLIESQASCNVLMAHPKANGFFGAKGPAGYIPFAYSIFANQFRKRIEKRNEQYRIKLFEYLKNGWTYHAKGLWYYPPDSEYPCLTMIGSPNFGGRSVNKDLETQLLIVTENKEFRKELHLECKRLFDQGLPVEAERKAPKWVNIFVLFFRNYF